MSENSKYMTRVNRMPEGTVLKREIYGRHSKLTWEGVIKVSGAEDIGPVRNPDLGTVMKHLLILCRRRKQGGLKEK